LIKIGLVVGLLTDERLQLAKQLGVDEIIGGNPYTSVPIESYSYGVAMSARATQPPQEIWEFEPLLRMRKRIEDAGLKISIIDSTPPLDKVKLGLPGRDKQIENFCKTLRNMSAAGINSITFNFTPIGTTRTSQSTRIRGDAQATSFDIDLMKNAPLTEHGVVTEEKMWDNWKYFIQKVIPVAEESNVRLAVHPDDPPVPSLKGIARNFSSFEGFKRVIETVDSEYNGVSFCVGCWSEMGEERRGNRDIPECIRYFGMRKRINFVHLRDVQSPVGEPTKFVEVFHDDGQTDMLACIRALKEVDYKGPVRPDHQARLAGYETLPDSSGYKLMGKFFAIGYIKGLIETVYGKQSTPIFRL